MSADRLVAFEAFAGLFRSYLDSLPVPFLPLINAQYGALGYIAPDGIYYVCFNMIWMADKYSNMSIAGRLLSYKSDGNWRCLPLRQVDFIKENMFTGAFSDKYYPHYMGESYRGYILNDTIQITSSDRELIIGFKQQSMYIGGSIFRYCKYYYDINFIQVKPIKTQFKGIEFAKIYDSEPIKKTAKRAPNSEGQYLYIQLATREYALYDGVSAPIILE